MTIPLMSELKNKEHVPEILFWVGCAGSFDLRAQQITKSFILILQKLNIDYAILGKEEMCTGDPARRSGNEFLFQTMAFQNIQILNGYNIKKIVTTCPHCFNTLKNEYPELGGQYEVLHHSEFLQQLINEGKLVLQGNESFKGKRLTFHDSCYLGRANGIYEAPREVIQALDVELTEMKRCRTNGMCCGAGGAQMFKEEEKGMKRVNEERANEAMALNVSFIATSCPFCNTMLSDGIKKKNKEDSIQILDIAELIAKSL